MANKAKNKKSPSMNCTPKVGQYDILKPTKRGAIFMPKGKPNKKYTGEFKQMVVESVIKDKLGYNEAMRKYGIGGAVRIQAWERIYLEEGAEGLYIERRGRASTTKGNALKGRPRKLDKQVEEDLLAEVQRLRAENEYLKNLQALVLEDERRQRRKRRG